MATYVPGAKQFVPDFKPFTPDYKFLSDVLQTKETRYSVNYRALNDLYGRVVYGNLSRQDTNQLRDQFANQLTSKLEQISGLDLSVEQNVEAAKAIFQPFYDNDLIVRDLINTTAYNNEMSYARLLQTSADEKQRDMWWQTGVQAMEYQMQDFINASPEEALKMAPVRYIPDADLATRTTNYLKEQGFNVERSIIDPERPEWIITTNTGADVTQQALIMAQEALADDPMIQNAYFIDAYVQSRIFADQEIAKGNYSTVQEARQAWAVQEIKKAEVELAARLVNEKQSYENQLANIRDYEAYIEKNGQLNDNLAQSFERHRSRLEASIAKIDATTKSLAQDPATRDNTTFEGLMNRAYNLLMNTNIQNDIVTGVNTFMTLNEKVKIEANDFVLQQRKFQHDWAIFNAEKEWDLRLRAADKEEEDLAARALAVFGGGVRIGDPGTTSLAGVDDYILTAQNQIVNYASDLKSQQVDLVIEAMDLLGQTSQNLYKINGSDFNADGAKAYLNNNPGVLADLYAKYNSILSNGGTDALEDDTYPDVATKPGYIDLASRFSTINGKINLGQGAQNTLNEVTLHNYRMALQTENGRHIQKALQDGIPSIVKPNGELLTLEDFSQLLSRTDFAYEPNIYGGYSASPDGIWASNIGAPYPVDSRTARLNHAKKYYDAQYQVLNEAMKGTFNTIAEDGTQSQLFRSFAPAAYFRGLSSDTPGDITSNPSYNYNVNMSTITDPDVYGTVSSFMNQLNTAPQSVYYHKGNLGTKENIDVKTTDTTAQALINALRLAASSADKDNFPYFSLSYNPVFGPADQDAKTTAGYVVTFNQDWLKKFANDNTGLISEEDINDYRTVSVLFDQNNDLSPRKSGQYNYSAFASNVNLSIDPNTGLKNYYFEENITGGGKMVGRLNSRGEYILEVTPYIYDQNMRGNTALSTISFNLSQMIADQNETIGYMDRIYNEKRRQLEQIALSNIARTQR